MGRSRSLPERLRSEEVSRAARDAAYVAVGLGVLGFQKAQVRRREITAHLTTAGDTGHERLGDLASASETLYERLERLGSTLSELPADLARSMVELDGPIEAMITRLETAMEPVEDKLPPATRQAVRQARLQAANLRQQLRRRLHDLAA